jgi:hypothetical protein
MRSLAALAVLCSVLSPGSASARRVIKRPTISSQCRTPGTWNQMAACVRRFGPFKVLHATADLKLISVGPVDDDFGIGGRYVFARHQNRWQYTGALGSEYKVDKISTEQFEGHKVHRLDLSRAAREAVPFADGVTQWGWVTERLAMFCSPEAVYCESIVTSCDVVVRGKTLNRFRGTISYIKDGEMAVQGDRGLAGNGCTQADHAYLPIPVGGLQ